MTSVADVASSPGRLLATEDLTPNGGLFRWLTPDLTRLGWQVAPVPTMEAVQLLGLEAYRANLLRAVEELRPDIVLVTPPYDFLDLATRESIRETGAHIIAWIIEAPSGDVLSAGDSVGDALTHFDLCLSPIRSTVLSDLGVAYTPWALSAESVAVDDPAAPAHEAVLVAPRTDELHEVVRAAHRRGIELACYGPGWPMGPVTRPSRLGLFRRANVVVTAAGQPLQMLEAALLGRSQLIARDASLLPYLAAHPEAATFEGAWDCVEQLRRVTRPASMSKPLGWAERWQQVYAQLPPSRELDVAELPFRSPALASLYAALGHGHERVGNSLASRACFDAWAGLDEAAAGPLMGQARCASDLDLHHEAADHAERALQRLPDSSAGFGQPLTRLCDEQLGFGLGRFGCADIRAELWTIRLNSLRLSGQQGVALREAGGLDHSMAQAVRQLLAASGCSDAVLEHVLAEAQR